MSKHLKKKFKRLWAKEKQQDLRDMQGPGEDIGSYDETNFSSMLSDIKRNWVDDIKGHLFRPLRRLKINLNEV